MPQTAAIHVDLKRVQDQLGHRQRRITRFADRDELVLRATRGNVRVRRLLFADRRFPARLAPVRLVVVADEDARRVREGENLLDQIPKARGAAAGKVGPRRAGIGHEQRVVNEGGIADHIGDRGERVARREHHPGVDLADPERLAFGKELVPLRAVGGEVGPVIEALPELLHLDHLLADRRRCAGLFLQVARG